ncbi:hypothetical protein CRENBAI_001500 [Crenichthys baileyi]|uniref:Uncharacterized protein n=1 Tax=Crenichthys baileyi TaxID=28760 RepID=A0AAV9QV03_9TELE
MDPASELTVSSQAQKILKTNNLTGIGYIPDEKYTLFHFLGFTEEDLIRNVLDLPGSIKDEAKKKKLLGKTNYSLDASIRFKRESSSQMLLIKAGVTLINTCTHGF